MNTPSLIALTLLCYALSWLLLWAEKKSKGWYQDRAMLFTAGMFLALAFVGTAWAVCSLL